MEASRESPRWLGSISQPLSTLGPRQQTFALSLFAAIGYFALGKLAFATGFEEGVITSVLFLPEGLALGMTILFGPRVWTGLFAGQCLLALSQGLGPDASVILGLTNSSQAVLGGYLFWRWRISRGLATPRDMGLFCILSLLVLQPLSATAGILTLYGLSDLQMNSLGAAWLYWWSSNTLGQLLVVPVILLWTLPASRRDRLELRKGLLTAGAYFAVVLVSGLGDWAETALLYRLIFFVAFFLGVIWLGVRCSPRTVSLTNLIMAAGLLYMVGVPQGFFRAFEAQDRFLYANLFALGGTASALLISSLFKELFDQKRELEKANAAKAIFFGVIAHDLRSPLANLQMLLDSMVDGNLNEAETRECQIALRQSLGHTVDALESLMEWGRLEMVSAQTRPAPVRLRKTATRTIKLFEDPAKGKSIQIDNLIPEEATVLADPHQLHSILRNLLSNAIKFTPAQGRVILSATRLKANWRLTLTDTGAGMTPKQVAQLFDSEASHASTRGTADEPGFGLGMRICSGFVRANQGTIQVDSTPGNGSSFHVTLPLSDETPGSPESEEAV